MMRTVYLSLGSNAGQSVRILSEAVRLTSQAAGGPAVECSRLYRSDPQLVTEQPTFFNAVVGVRTGLGARDLLHALQEAVLSKGFKKSQVRFGPRELDIDIIGFSDGERVSEGDILEIPHPRAHLRDFVVRPLCDMNFGSQLVLANGRKAVQCLDNTPDEPSDLAHSYVWSESFHPTPLVMGILNVTPDSFSDGGMYFDAQKAIARAKHLAAVGSHVIDVGGESTRPNAEHVSEEEELARVLPVIEALSNDSEFKCKISIDTRKPNVARKAIQSGANFLNDQAGEEDEDTEDALRVASELNVPIITMHTRGDPRTMEQLHVDDEAMDAEHADIVDYVTDWLIFRAEKALQRHNIPKWNLMIDPGLGFAKSHDQSMKLLSNLDHLVRTGYPVLVGASRKRFIRRHSKFDPDVTTAGSTVAAAFAGAAMVRVHSVPHAVDVIDFTSALNQNRRGNRKANP